MDIIAAFEKSLGEYESIQKSRHWKKYDARRHLYTFANLINFRNNQLSEGLDQTFPPKTQREIYLQLVAELGKKYVRENLTDKNIGNGRDCFMQAGLVVDGGQNYTIRWLYDLEATAFAEKKIRVVCEIGGGYGALAQKIRTRFGCKFILIDLPEANILSSYYLSQHFPDARFLLADEMPGKTVTKEMVERYDFIIIPPWYKLADDVMVDLFINTRSMMEMNIDVIARYFSLIQSHTVEGGFFFNLNRYQKRSVGYPIQLSKYPYDKKWDVVLSKPAWRQEGHHFLLTRRTRRDGNIGEEMRRIAEVAGHFIPKSKTLPGRVWRGFMNRVNRFRHQYF
jgi:putative sugar O-methyltransferase